MRVDAAVVGGGPAGAAAALRLAEAGATVILYERSSYGELRMGETLPPSVNPLLRTLGVWAPFLALAPMPSHETASAWGGPEMAERSFVFSPYGNGWHTDRARFDQMLTDAAAAAGAMVRLGVGVRGVRRVAGGFAVDAGTPVVADVVVDATGRSARVARGLGARRARSDRLVCAARVFAMQPGVPAGDTIVEAVPDGWWYTAPLPADRRLMAAFTDARRAAEIGLASPAGWAVAAAGTEHMRTLAVDRPAGPVHVVSAASHHLTPAAGPGWLAVGDAALAVDPLSSGGVGFALQTGMRAAEVLLEDAADGYRELVDNAAEEYYRLRREVYGWEARFAADPFWRGRAG